ncbi:MAG: S8 family serine peptidase [Bdellovibrionales bacterium]|nr:S8 family serine peptidase [Bdellovibrionales bacterium]
MTKWLTALLTLGALQAHANASNVDFVPGEYLVRLKSSIENREIHSIAQKLSIEVKEVMPTLVPLVLVQTSVVIKDTHIIKALMENPEVENVERNLIYRASALPNDKEFEKLWGLKNTGQEDPGSNDPDGRPPQEGIAGMDIDAERAWEITTGSANVVVGIIDSGIDVTNPDLVNNIWINAAEASGQAGVDDDNNGYVDDVNGYDFVKNKGQVIDENGHGTHVSGTIGGQGNNNSAVAGVNWTVRMMGLRFLNAQGGGTLGNAIKAIDYATKMGARITNNSWGGGGYSDELRAAIQRASDAGILFVAAAGNDASNNDQKASYPSNYQIPNVISVAAIDNRGELADFSCFGKRMVHIGAPGVNILSTTPKGLASYSGTSMATPHVTGVAALVLSQFPNLTLKELRDRVVKTARPIPGLKGRVSTGALLNAYNALENLQAPPDPNDPENWPKEPFHLSGQHPYPDNASIKYTVRVPGAKRFALYFKNFDTENNYDFIEFLDPQGNVLDKWSGNRNGEYTLPIDGDSVVLKFTSDTSVNKHGWDIERVAVDR